MLSYRRFDDLDWQGLAGAERFESGRDPVIADGEGLRCEGLPALVVGSRGRVEVQFGDGLEMWVGLDVESELDVLVMLEKLPERMDLEILEGLGFQVNLDELIEMGDYEM
jgi:hypothetical protein